MTEGGSWTPGTWGGARRASVERALRRTVRERLQVMAALSETARHLARVGRIALTRAAVHEEEEEEPTESDDREG